MPYISFVVNVTPPVFRFCDSPVFHSEKDENMWRQALKPFVYGLFRFVVIILYGHSCASLLLANGVPMKKIQDWLGHSDFSTTANVYAHLEFDSKISSANALLSGLSLE
jgi:site-specific recombinase XerD